MLVNATTNNHVKFISYSGKYPNLCRGLLCLKIDGELVKFGDYDWKTKMGNRSFWKSGGQCGFFRRYKNSYINKGEWIIDVDDIPEQYRKYAEEIERVFNDNVPYGCCGGCL